MKRTLIVSLLAALTCGAAGNSVAARLASEAKKAENSGQFVRAYLLYSAAAARDPNTPSYRQNRDAIAPVAKLLSKAQLEQTADVSADIKTAEQDVSQPDTDPGLQAATYSDIVQASQSRLQGLPHLQPNGVVRQFSLREDTKALFEHVTQVYGIKTMFDKDLDAGAPIHFEVDGADFQTVMEALTDATQTFIFPISANTIYVARDTEQKRSELEPTVVYTVPLPEALDPKDLTDAANAVRGTLNMRSLAFDAAARTIIIRERVSKARIARSLLEALLLPKAQVALEVELLSVDSDVRYHYGLSLPTSVQLLDLGRLGGLKTVFTNFSSATTFLGFGGGATLIGVGISQATLFATYSKSFTRSLYDAIVTAGDNQAATFHVGDKYPIPQSIYSGFQQSGSSSLYNPIGQVTLEDLGLELKLTPHVSGNGDIALDVEAAFKALGTQSIDSVPEISQREYKGNVRLAEGEWAVIAGIDQSTKTLNRKGLAGLSQIPGLAQVLSENTRDDQQSQTLLVIKPHITRLPMSGLTNPQYLIGPQTGIRVLL